MTTRPDSPENARLDKTKLMHRRMIALRLDFGAVARLEPAILRDMQRVCATCGSPQRCADDLVTHSDDPTCPEWRDYCQNAAKMDMLFALQYF
jgi:hypothetical protein